MMDKLILLMKNGIDSLNNSVDEEDQKMKSRLEKYLKILENDLAFEDSEFKELFKYISSNSLLDDEKKNILLELGYYYWVHNDHSKEEVEIIDENSTYLDVEDIIKLLKEFGFSDDFIEKIMSYKRDFDNLRKYSSLEKIKSILGCFKGFGLVADDFSERERQLLQILIHSNIEVIKVIIEYIKEDLILEGYSDQNEEYFKKRFREYLGHVTLFGEKTRVLRKKDKKKLSTSTTPSKNDFVGTFNNYRDNREFLKKMGVTIKLDSLSTLEKSSQLVKSNYYLLRRYGFTNEDIERSLSVLSVSNLEYLLDLAIELRIFDRFKKYPSHYVSFNSFIAMRIKYCKIHNISIDGRNKEEISSKISKQSAIFDEHKGGPEVHGESKEGHVSFDSEKVGRMIGEYRKVMGIQKPMPLLVNMTESEVDVNKIDDIEFEKSYRKSYFRNLINDFDSWFSYGTLQYVFKKNDMVVVISKLKVQKNLSRILYNEFIGRLHDYNFNYFSNILLYCIEKNSILTEEEKKVIEENVYYYVDNLNQKFIRARGDNGSSNEDSGQNTLDTYRRR